MSLTALCLSLCVLRPFRLRRGIIELGQVKPFQLVIITAHYAHPDDVLGTDGQRSSTQTSSQKIHLDNINEDHQIVVLQIHRVLRTDCIGDYFDHSISLEFLIASNRRANRVLHEVIRSAMPENATQPFLEGCKIN